MPYQANKPAATDQMSVSQADLQNNFLSVKALVDVNHETFGSAYEGKHTVVSLPQQTTSVVPPVFPPATTATELAVYAKDSGGATHLFLRPTGQTAGVDTNDINLTSNVGLVTPGWCMLPNGLIMKWGQSGLITPGTIGTAVLVSGAGVPTITTLLNAQITNIAGGSHENVFYYSAFSEASHTVSAYLWKVFGSSTAQVAFSYLLLGK